MAYPRDGKFAEMPASEDGLFRSGNFPGLWLDPDALTALDGPGVVRALQRALPPPNMPRSPPGSSPARRPESPQFPEWRPDRAAPGPEVRRNQRRRFRQSPGGGPACHPGTPAGRPRPGGRLGQGPHHRRADRPGARDPRASPAREMDMLLSTGEQVSVALMAMAIQALGVPAISFTGAQIGIVTDSFHTKARIRNISTERMAQALDSGKVVIVAGIPGGRRALQHHDPRPGRLRHHGRRPGRRPRGRRLRDLHRCRWRLHDRPPRRARGPQDRPHQLRRDARTGQPRRRGDALAVGRVRQEIRRADPRPKLVLRRPRHLDRRRGRRPTARSQRHRGGAWRRTRRASPSWACPTGPASSTASSARSPGRTSSWT